MLTAAIILITAALVLYSVGIWAERVQRRLKWWHALFFALGFGCDLSGTLVMTQIAGSSPTTPVSDGAGSTLTVVMAVSGTIALTLMGVHLVWAIVVLLRNDNVARGRFHRLSVLVWAIWLVPYVTGALAANVG